MSYQCALLICYIITRKVYKTVLSVKRSNHNYPTRKQMLSYCHGFFSYKVVCVVNETNHIDV
jgi:hypothetical protein